MSDPSDPGGVGANAERGRGTTRVGDSGSPVGSPLTVVLALIAVVVGFLIFRSIDNSDAGGLDPGEGATSTVAGASTTTAAGTATTVAPATTTATRTTEGATVIVANASSASGVAAQMTEQLQGVGYTTAEPTDATGANLDTSVVYYVSAPPQIQAVAQSVARDLGGLEVQTMPSPIPVTNQSIGTATVLVMLGDDIAGQSLDDIADERGTNVQAPAPATTAG
jgi:hypothetical protein